MSALVQRWWHGAVGYEVYIRSFADGDGDGVGDLPGLRERLPHLADLGVDVVWITPFYPSPGHDHGYDVADYRDVDPLFGTIEDFDAMLAEAHALGLRVMVDLVPNHTSSEHPWFQAARSGRASPYRDWYVWRDPAPDGGPPNNWISHFGGPAWTFDEASGQFYLHLFLPEQPDLNWSNPAVADEFDSILEFWLDRGADGVRIDVAHALVKDAALRDNPLKEGRAAPTRGEHPRAAFDAYEHLYDLDQAGVLDVYRRWNRVAARYDAVLLGEVYLLDPERVRRYVDEQDALHVALYLRLPHVAWEPAELHRWLRLGVEVGGHNFAWPLASHDDPRAPTRFGGGDLGRARALAFATMLAGLPGMFFLYQGEELGLENAEVAPQDATDPVTVRNAGALGRDGVRTPIPWAPGPGWGFTTAERAWLPFGDRRPEDTAAVQRQDLGSVLHRYRALIATRHELDDLDGDTEVQWLTQTGPVVAYRRGSAVVAANVEEAEQRLELPEGDWTVRFATDRTREGAGVQGTIVLPATSAVVLEADR